MNILIVNGEIIDGTGNESFFADILIKDGKFDKIDKDIKCDNAKIIDARGYVISPGFIDMHSHSDATILRDRYNSEKLQQGITTEVNGNCGFGLYPITKSKTDLQELVNDLVSVEFFIKEEDIKWDNFNSYCEHYKNGFGTNQVPLVPHGPIRIDCVGVGDKPITEEYLKLSRIKLSNELNSGCWGMSTGLAYSPGCFATYDELKSYCMELKKHNKIYVTHMRNEEDEILDSIDEVIRLAIETGCRVHISHLKLINANKEQKIDSVISKISDARRNGVEITADIYPYNASCTMLSVLLPNYVRRMPMKELSEALKDKEFCSTIEKNVSLNLEKRGGGNKVFINYLSYKYNENIIGKSLNEVADIFNLSEVDTIFKLIADCDNKITAIYYSISDEGINKLINEDFIVFGTDGTVNFDNPSASHPRTYGSFTKILATYVRELNIISIEKAIQKMTYNTAKIVGLKNRGVIKEGYFADIVIFDKNTIKDNSTFKDAYQFSTGIKYVLVNGKISFENGDVCKMLNGEILKSV